MGREKQESARRQNIRIRVNEEELKAYKTLGPELGPEIIRTIVVEASKQYLERQAGYRIIPMRRETDHKMEEILATYQHLKKQTG